MVEVFQTNVKKIHQAKKLVNMLLGHFPDSKINFDLQDCDKILRVEANELMADDVELLVNEHGFMCKALQ